nr:MAG TPA: hypothetical protein [Caudoviricetes sp.]
MIFNPALSGGGKSGWELIGMYENSVTVTPTYSTESAGLKVLLPDVPSQDFLKMVINVDYSWNQKSSYSGTPTAYVKPFSSDASDILNSKDDATSTRMAGRGSFFGQRHRAPTTGKRKVMYAFMIPTYTNMLSWEIDFTLNAVGVYLTAIFDRNAYNSMTMKATVELYGSDL